MRRRDLIATALGAAAATVLASGIAWAAIPEGGVIQGCYDSGGNLKVVAALPCAKGYTALQWNQQGSSGPSGPSGPAGATGPSGPSGPDGVSPTVAQLASGDANCPTGGAAITDAAGSTAYVCNGQDGTDGQSFAGTFTSPNGEYAISVTDGGITIAHGSSNAIVLVGDDLTVQSDDVAVQTGDLTVHSDDLAVQSTRSTTLRAGTTMAVDVTGNLSLITSATGLLRAAGPLNLQGSVVNIN